MKISTYQEGNEFRHFSNELGSSKSLTKMELKLAWNNIGEKEALDLQDSIAHMGCLKSLVLRLDM